MVPRENPLLATNLTWVPEEGWTENDPLDNLINGPIFNGPVWQTGDVNKKK